ncbi:MAG: lysyl oxidase family protein [Bacteroidota bacterium]|nr:lysyl oxidase family protein [Bacteroidota bacterium]
MKKLVTCLFLIFACFHVNAQSSCTPGNTEIIIQIIPDAWPYETSWELNDINGNLITSGLAVGDTVCVPSNSCVIFTIYDTFGDGIYAPGGYWVYADGILVASGNAFGSIASHPIACAPGMFCSSSLPLNAGTFTAPFDNTFYVYTCTVTGTYNITTCGMNTCNTKIWVYSNCSGNVNDEGPVGTFSYNDDAGCGLQADLNVVFMAGQTYYIRIGDNADDCTGAIDFTFSYVGPVQGCTDPQACNYNPLAVIDDGSCIYFPNPACAGPDLKFDSLAFVNSLTMMTINASACDVDEGCVTGYGTRYVVAFTSKIDNIGPLDYYIGSPFANPTMFNTVNCHGHAHYEGYGDYRLYDTNNNLIPVGHKNGFCVIDLCGFGQYTCGNMGISAGCYDVYGVGTQCQWIDITDVPDGQYRLAIIVNSYHLPDALNHYEINHANNAIQICIEITSNSSGVKSYSLLPTCTPYVDCMGIPGGAAMPDCNGICGGSSMYGNINNDLVLDSVDVLEYANELEDNTITPTPCNDLNGDGEITVYDAALAMWCNNTPHQPHPAGSNFNDCNFPHNILNINDTTGLAIADVNFGVGYVDVELFSKNADIKAFQFSLSGVTVNSVVSLADPVEFPVDIRVVGNTNEIFAISHEDSAFTRSNSAQLLCRIYFSAITDTVICIDEIKEIINQDIERTVTYIYGNCWTTNFSAIAEINGNFRVAIVPNPASSMAYLQLPHYSIPDKVELIDMTGKLIPMPVITKGSAYGVDVSSLASGIYHVRIYSGNKTGYTRFSKM